MVQLYPRKVRLALLGIPGIHHFSLSKREEAINARCFGGAKNCTNGLIAFTNAQSCAKRVMRNCIRLTRGFKPEPSGIEAQD